MFYMSFIEADTEQQKDTIESNTTDLVILTLFQISFTSYFQMCVCYQLMNYQDFELICISCATEIQTQGLFGFSKITLSDI